MSQFLSPGVYMKEIPGIRPIEGVGTAIAAFVGVARAGAVNEPKLVTSWRQYTEAFGEQVGNEMEPFVEGSYLAHAVYGFFANGGSRCYVVNVGGAPAPTSAAPEAEADPATPDDADAAPSGDEADEAGEGGEAGASGTRASSRRASRAGTEVATTSGGVPARVGPSELVGSSADRTGVAGLEAIDEVTMVCVPDLMAVAAREGVDGRELADAQKRIIDHCSALGDRVAILDPPPSLDAQQVADWRQEAGFDSSFGTMYWPWLEVANPAARAGNGNGGSPRTILVPPSGHLAGIWARVDATRGVHKAPANEQVRGVVGFATRITRAEQDGLNPIGVNCLREFPGSGLRVWGARTLSESDSSWRYINIRRLFNYLEESILEAMQWVVFEPNDRLLWATIRRQIGAFLVNVWRSGALFGATPDEAFYVKCDDETNPQEGIEAGEVVCEIGVAAVKPAEFIVFKIHQLPTGVSVVAE